MKTVAIFLGLAAAVTLDICLILVLQDVLSLGVVTTVAAAYVVGRFLPVIDFNIKFRKGNSK